MHNLRVGDMACWLCAFEGELCGLLQNPLKALQLNAKKRRQAVPAACKAPAAPEADPGSIYDDWDDKIIV